MGSPKKKSDQPKSASGRISGDGVTKVPSSGKAGNGSPTIRRLRFEETPETIESPRHTQEEKEIPSAPPSPLERPWSKMPSVGTWLQVVAHEDNSGTPVAAARSDAETKKLTEMQPALVLAQQLLKAAHAAESGKRAPAGQREGARDGLTRGGSTSCFAGCRIAQICSPTRP